MNKSTKVLCCCSGGKVRSVATKFILEDTYGFRNVLACGIDKNSPETLGMLFEWADVILIIGEKQLAEKAKVPTAIHLDVGPDCYGHYGHGDLQKKLREMIQPLVEV